MTSADRKQLRVVSRFFKYAGVGDGCWEWTGYVRPNGYGCFAIQYRKPGAHRYAYQLFRGPIPTGLTLDHLCKNRVCVNPWHLEPVSLRENLLRSSDTQATINAKKRACINGHPFDKANTGTQGGGRWRDCRTCRRESQQRRRKERRV